MVVLQPIFHSLFLPFRKLIRRRWSHKPYILERHSSLWHWIVRRWMCKVFRPPLRYSLQRFLRYSAEVCGILNGHQTIIMFFWNDENNLFSSATLTLVLYLSIGFPSPVRQRLTIAFNTAIATSQHERK